MEAPTPAGVLRRLGAFVYDLLVLTAILIVATFPFVPFLDGRVLVPEEVGALAYVYWAWQLVVIAAFLGYFWTSRGRTVGMLAWRLRIERLDGANLRWSDAMRRLALVALLCAPEFVGYQLFWRDWPKGSARTLALALGLAPLVVSWLWIWIDRDRLALHDRWSATRLIVLPKGRPVGR